LATGQFYTVLNVSFDPSRDYPLGSERPDLVTTPGGLTLDQLELHGEAVSPDELRATPQTLRLQAEVARAAGRPQLAANLVRAAELATIPNETILEIYGALRPGRSTQSELETWARRLDEWEAPQTAAFVRDAVQAYAERGLFAG
jgi:propanediol dehydratase small subunit